MEEITQSPSNKRTGQGLAAALWRAFAYLGLMSIFGSLFHGFRYDAAAPSANLWFDLGIYALFLAPHLLMTRSWWKRIWTRNPAGTPSERRFYIASSVVTWILVVALHRPVGGAALQLPAAAAFVGTLLLLIAFFLFFQGMTTAMLDGFLGVPGAVQGYSHGPDTPLFTEGAYASVRHPMYRAALLGGLASLLIHPHMGQLLFVLLMGGTFVAFIPVEEAQMAAARGDDYRRYREKTPWRIFRGIW